MSEQSSESYIFFFFIFQVDTYLKEILDDLLANMTSNLWRSRESSCRALADVIVGRNMDDVVDYLPRLWEDTFKVMDDIKVPNLSEQNEICSLQEDSEPRLYLMIDVSFPIQVVLRDMF